MARKLARLVQVGAVAPIPGADRIEVARVGGWASVIPKGSLQEGDLGVYFEIDSFLPTGVPAWQFLVDKQPTDFEGGVGHVLHTVRLQKQLSQGLLLPANLFNGKIPAGAQPGDDLTAALGVLKYDKPLPPDLAKVARGYLPSGIPETDQERIQNLSAELTGWQTQGVSGLETWERTEKLEGESTTFALLERELHACSRRVDFLPSADVAHWKVAARLQLQEKLRERYGDRPVALRGEMVGPGFEGNYYRLQQPQFFLYDVYDVQAGCSLLPAERRALATDLGLPHVPVLDTDFALEASNGMQELLDAADGPSLLVPHLRREGDVYKSNTSPASFKAVSNAYLLKQKLK